MPIAQHLEIAKAHAYLDDSDSLTVPKEQLELIILYVRWATYQEPATTESTSPDPILNLWRSQRATAISSTLEVNAERAERAYRKMLSPYKETTSTSDSAQCNMDRFDRIY